MAQPYLEEIDEHGETGLVFVGGAYSHAFRKGPLLPRDAAPVEGLFAFEHITPREPGALGARGRRRRARLGDRALRRAALRARGRGPAGAACWSSR